MEAVFTANHLTDTDKQNSTGKYKLNTNTDRYTDRQTDTYASVTAAFQDYEGKPVSER